MSKTRSETDSLGPIEVPAEALYGAQTMRAVANFPISGLKAYPFLIRALAMVKLAAAETNRELGLISKEQGDAIAAAAREVLDGRHHEHFVVDVFQAVEIEIDQAGRASVAFDMRHRTRQFAHEGAAVIQRRQRVAVGQTFEFGQPVPRAIEFVAQLVDLAHQQFRGTGDAAAVAAAIGQRHALCFQRVE